jgi:hypothetical protein
MIPFRLVYVSNFLYQLMTSSSIILISFLLFPGCAEKRVPDDEHVREYLYAIKPLELWLPTQSDQMDLDHVSKIMDEKFLRKYMRISEMGADKYLTRCVEVAKKALQDAGFFMNNSRGRKNFEDLNALSLASPDEFSKMVKERCDNSLGMLKGRAHVRELKKRKTLSTDQP